LEKRENGEKQKGCYIKSTSKIKGVEGAKNIRAAFLRERERLQKIREA